MHQQLRSEKRHIVGMVRRFGLVVVGMAVIGDVRQRQSQILMTSAVVIVGVVIVGLGVGVTRRVFGMQMAAMLQGKV